MTLPISFLLGIAIVLLHEQFDSTLPGQFTIETIWPFLALLPLPWLLARAVATRLHSEFLRLGVLERRVRLWIRVPGIAVPLVYACIVFGGGLPEVAHQISPHSEFLHHALLLGPLVAMEVSVRLGEARTSRWIDAWGMTGASPIGPSRLPMMIFLLCPILLFSAMTDVVFRDRQLEVFFGGTALGSSIGLVLLVIALCAALPLFFRWTMPISNRLPPGVDHDVRATARALAFPENRIVALRTGHRIVNAALVGPLPWPRYLVLSDGILMLLDRRSLQGVVAHEIGHAKARHPVILLLVFVLIPILLLQPTLAIDFAAIDPAVLAIGGGLAAAAAVWSLRRLAHRFEFEADELSAEALGGAEPCVDALRRVGDLYPTHRYRASFRHPSEVDRIAHLQAWASDSDYRRSQRRRSRGLRAIVAVAVLLALGASGIVHSKLWPVDRATYLLYSGEFGEARAQLERLSPDAPLISAAHVDELRAEADAAIALVGPGGPGRWNELRDELASKAWEHGVGVLIADGAQTALPWLSLALSDDKPDVLRSCLYLWASAVVEKDAERAEELREHMFSLGVPERIGDALRAQSPKR